MHNYFDRPIDITAEKNTTVTFGYNGEMVRLITTIYGWGTG